MSIEDIIRAWKTGEQDKQDQQVPENPVGYELSDEELEAAVGGQEAAGQQTQYSSSNTFVGIIICSGREGNPHPR